MYKRQAMMSDRLANISSSELKRKQSEQRANPLKQTTMMMYFTKKQRNEQPRKTKFDIGGESVTCLN